MDQEVADYITKAQRHGLSDFEIKQNLLNAGWEAALIEQSFVFARAAENKASVNENPHAQNSIPARTPGQAIFLTARGQPQLQTLTPLQSLHFHSAAENQNFRQEQKPLPHVFKKSLLWVTIVVLLLLAGGAYGYYNYIYITPTRIWENFLAVKKPSLYKADFTISYADNSGASGTASSTPPISVSFSDNASVDATTQWEPRISNKSSLAFNSGGLSYNSAFDYLILDQIIYLDIGQINQLKNLFGGQNNIEWLKLDLNELSQYAAQTMPGNPPININQGAVQGQLATIWSDPSLVTPTDFLAREKVNGTAVYHLKPLLNSRAINAALLSSLNAIQSAQNSSSTKLTDEQEQALTALFNKFQAKQFDVWIGQKDYQLYKIDLVSNSPSIQDLSNSSVMDLFGPVGAAREKSRDAQRLADMRQTSTALELYFNDNDGYPPADANGQPLGLAPNYLLTFPTSPEPADGTCTDYYNGYWYTPSGKPRTIKGVKAYPSYTLTFCLGADTGGYGAGIAELAPPGITANIPCPTTADKCVSSAQAPENNIITQINQMNFGAQVTFSAVYSAFGQPESIAAPQSSTDILDLLKGMAVTPSTASTSPGLSQ